MKFKYTTKMDKLENYPNQGLFFAIKKDDIYGLDNLEDYFNIEGISNRTRIAIQKRMDAMTSKQILFIEPIQF